MSTFLKFTLPALFAAAGLAVAICLALGTFESPSTDEPGTWVDQETSIVAVHPLNHFPRFLSPKVSLAVLDRVNDPVSLASSSEKVNASSRTTVPTQYVPESAADAAPVQGETSAIQSPRVAQAPEIDGAFLLDVLTNPEKLQKLAQPQTDYSQFLKGDDAKAAAANANTNPFAGGGTSPLSGLLGGGGGDSESSPEQASPADLPEGNSGEAGGGSRPLMVIKKSPGEGDDRLSLTIPGEDLNKVLQLLSAQGDLNILASKNVQGTVSASLKNVDIETALDAILKSTGFIWWRDGRFIHVGTPQDRISMQQYSDKIGTRLYRPNYVKAADLQALITPILTPDVGTISVTTPSQVGIAPDGNSAGGDSFAGQEALLVRDYEIVLAEVDQIVQQVDLRPTQVAIEAMILAVNLTDKDELGVDFEALRDQSTIRVASGNPLGSLAQMDFSSGGLKVGFLDSSLALFLNALESIGDTNVIATPRIMCLNKHRAEILIGEQLGYVSTTQTETSTTQSVEFLEVGTQLRLRPFISSDGMVRMEVHPELSTGNVRLVGNFTLPDKQVTQVTTNIMVRDGCTVIIGGLLRDQMSSTATQIPLFGSLPVIGAAFRKNSEELGRQEILVLITPRIVFEPDACCRGDLAATEFHHRQSVYADQMLPFSKRYLGRKYFRLAQMAWDAGNARQALRLINLAIHFDPLNRAAIDLRVNIWHGNPVGDHTLPPERGGPMLEGEQVPDWLLQRLNTGTQNVHHPVDPGRPGNSYNIIKPDPPASLPLFPANPIHQPQAPQPPPPAAARVPRDSQFTSR